jgi:hypothetical protein
MDYWRRAALRPLYLAPDQPDNSPVEGPRFLRDINESILRQPEGSQSNSGSEEAGKELKEDSRAKDVAADGLEEGAVAKVGEEAGEETQTSKS